MSEQARPRDWRNLCAIMETHAEKVLFDGELRKAIRQVSEGLEKVGRIADQGLGHSHDAGIAWLVLEVL